MICTNTFCNLYNTFSILQKTVCTIDTVFTLTSLKFSCALMVEMGLVLFRLSSQPILLFDTELTSFPGPEKFWGREGDIFGFEICNLFWSPLNRFPSWIGCETDRDDKTYEWDLDLFLSHPGLIFPPLPEISFQLLCCKQSPNINISILQYHWCEYRQMYLLLSHRIDIPYIARNLIAATLLLKNDGPGDDGTLWRIIDLASSSA